MSEDGEWGSNRELVAISAIINRPLLIYQHDY